MGFFSWITQDTKRNIYNHYTGKDFPVMMTDNKGNRWIEYSYGGYGVFGGKDYYELMAEMNGLTTREEGIKIQFDETGKYPNALYPNLTEDMQWTWRNEKPEDCEYQGFFFDDEDEHLDYDDDDHI